MYIEYNLNKTTNEYITNYRIFFENIFPRRGLRNFLHKFISIGRVGILLSPYYILSKTRFLTICFQK